MTERPEGTPNGRKGGRARVYPLDKDRLGLVIEWLAWFAT